MKVLKIVLYIYIIGVVFSCKQNLESKDVLTSDEKQSKSLTKTNSNDGLVANFEKISFNIDGMTCEIGCARTIQSKLSKVKGVKDAEVSFEKKKGVVEYDKNEITVSQIVEVVEKIAGGDLYYVKGVENIK